ncbi:MAG TPA: hypothetical protein VH419_07720 [Nocardioidaceae bacterium]|jgi:hypothetical protein
MTNRQRGPGWLYGALGGLVVLLAAIAVTVSPEPAWAVVDCTNIAPGSTADTDGDGFTDAQECAGLNLDLGTTRTRLEPCGSPNAGAECVDPNKKDLFVIYRPATTGSLLGSLPNPFGSNSFLGIRFTGLSTLGVAVHQITSAQAGTDRRVSSVSPEKAVRVTESLSDGALTDPLGYCQFGTPQSLDGCTVYTKRITNFIASKCNGAGDTTTDRNQVFLAYATYVMIHETGHSVGGLAAKYNAAYGGYHYSPTANSVMSQSAQYSTQANKCTWYIPSVWNQVLDPPAIILK